MTRPSTTGRTSDETSLSLVCDENFGSGTLTESTQVRPSRQSSPVSVDLLLLRQARAFGIAGDLPGQRAAQADQMGAAVALRDVVGEAAARSRGSCRSTTARLRRRCVSLAVDDDRLVDQRRLGAVEIAYMVTPIAEGAR